jgi:hypothetical protein
MTFLIFVGVFFVAIVFFHTIQGFFSATLSAILTVFSAVIAFSYHETVVEKLLGGKMADEAHALVLLGLFGLVYLILRIIFDNVVKDDVRMPSAVNKAGAAVMGVIAAIFATGIMAIAAQELPFEISIGQFSRYQVQDERTVVVPAQRSLDREEFAELSYSQPGKFGEEGTGQGVPVLPVDNIVVGAVSKLADGALSSGKPLESIHPNFLDELFGQRMGMEAGANHVAMNLPDKHQAAMDVPGLYSKLIPTSNQKDDQFAQLRNGGALKPIPLNPSSSDMFLVVRVAFKNQAADQKDHIVRFSPGTLRLVAPASGGQADEGQFVDYYPVGTLQDASTLWLNKLDDYLYVQISDHDQGVDLVYKVPRHQFEKKAPDGTFIEFKRLARVDLSNKPVEPGPTESPDFNPLRRKMIISPPPPPEPPPQLPKPAPEPQPSTSTPAPAPTTPTPAPAGGVEFQQAAVSDAVPAPLSAPAGSEGTLVQVPGGAANITDKKLKMANVDSTDAEQTQPVKPTQFAAPAGQVMVQVTAVPGSSSPWQFNNEPDQYEIVDSTGKRFQPSGVFATYDAKGATRFYLRFVDNTTISGASPPDNSGPPTKVVLMYLVPANTNLTEFDDHGKKSHDMSLTAK